MKVQKQIVQDRIINNRLSRVGKEKEVLFKYKGKMYPSYIKEGNAISYINNYAEHFIKGDVLDVGGTKEWHYPESEYVNISVDNDYHAMSLPKKKYDSIISSHCLEHLKDPYYALQHWKSRLNSGGCMFLYLPHVDMEYWSFYNPKHLHIFTPEMVKGWLKKLGFTNIITSGQDLYWSFSVVGWKR